jgi:predicted nicotinamide N-methyase
MDEPDDAPLPLKELESLVSASTFEWLEEAEQKDASWEKIQRSVALFQQLHSAAATAKQTPRRVRYWRSSMMNPDGYGGIEGADEELPTDEEEGTLQVVYILSDHWQGFGNQVWPAARHLANQFADATKCRDLLLPLFSHTVTDTTTTRHPLNNTSLLELGTGAGLPSWIALECGARVVSVDQAIQGRIRCLAECAERNWRRLKHDGGSVSYQKPKVAPYDWGSPVDDVVKLSNERFDVVCATECCFMPWFHSELLESVDMLLSDRGVGLLAFALHGNVSDDDIWSMLDLAHDKGLLAEVLPAEQLTTQTPDMDPKQALVYIVRLTRQRN